MASSRRRWRSSCWRFILAWMAARRSTLKVRACVSPPVHGFGACIVLLTCRAFPVACAGSILLKFQSRVEEDPYGAMVGWSPRDSDPCSWNGVRCVDGRVVTL